MNGPEETRLRDTLERIEALYAGAKTPGERAAAGDALARIRARLEKVAQTDPPVEYQFRFSNSWSRRLFMALLRRYGLKPYRYPRQKYTTVMARVPLSFVNETLWPEFVEIDKILCEQLEEITERLISEAVFADSSEAAVEPERLT